MDFDTKQQPKLKKKKIKAPIQTIEGESNLFFDTDNFCSCLEHVIHYSGVKKLITTFVDIKNEEMPDPLYDTAGLEWQVWRRDYGEVVKYYWYNHVNLQNEKVLEETTNCVANGYTRLYRGLSKQYLPATKKVSL